MQHLQTDNLAQIQNLLEKEIKNSSGPVCIQAGHFALISNKNAEVIPAIFEDIEDKEISEDVKSHPYMGQTPGKTFKLGVQLAEFGKKLKKEIKLLLIVNDWQWIKKLDQETARTRRERFYATSGIPKSFENELQNHALTDDIFVPFKNESGDILNPLFFSEIILRDQFDHSFAASCPVGNSCAQEYIPLLSNLDKQGFKLLISFVPKTCRVAVEQGTSKFVATYDSEIRVINIFVNGIFQDNFWENVDISIE